MHAPITMSGDICSVTGQKENNEDYGLVAPGLGACLADGIGGERMGGVVARCACNTAMRALSDGKTACQSLTRAHLFSKELACGLGCGRCGAALAVVRCDGGCAQVAWAGDVMCMLLRTGGDELVRLTVPDRGRRGVTNAVGIDMRANVADFELGEGDRVLLCTDGVWENVDEAELCHVLQTARTPREAAVRVAIGRGNRDDATAVVLFVDAGVD